MNNEDTLYLNNEEDTLIQNETSNPVASEKKNKMSSKAKVAVAGAASAVAGAALGAGSVGVAVAANQSNEDQISDTIEPETESDASETILAEEAPAAPSEEPRHVTYVTNNYYTSEPQAQPEPINETLPEDQTVYPVQQQELVVEPVDDEVRILGVETVQTPDGHNMDVVGVAMGDDVALFVDLEQDGTLDLFIHDDNGNNQIEENEIHDISDAHLHMSDLGIEVDHNDYYMTSDEDPVDNYDDLNIMPL